MTVRARQARSRFRRAERRRERTKLYEDRLATSSRKVAGRQGKVVPVGLLDGKEVYTCKPVSANYAAARRSRWLNRMARRLHGTK
jgi:hypothetical protein